MNLTSTNNPSIKCICNSITNILSTLTFLFFILTTSSSLNASPSPHITNEVSELIFKNCEKTLKVIENNNSLLSSFQKTELVIVLSRVLSLGTEDDTGIFAQNPAPSSPNIASMPFQTTDLSRILDPGIEENAKNCAMMALAHIGKEASPLIPQLLSIASDRKASSQLREKAFSTSIFLAEKIDETLSEDLRLYLIREMIKHDTSLANPFAIAPTLALVDAMPDEILSTLPELKKSYDTILFATEILRSQKTEKGELPTSILIKKLPTFAKSLRTKVLSSVLQPPVQREELFIQIPNLLASTSDDLKPMLNKAILTIASSPISYLPRTQNNVETGQLISSYLKLISSSDPETQIGILKLIAPVRIAGSNIICEPSNKEIGSPLLSLIPSPDYLAEIAKAHICEPSREQITYHTKNLDSPSFAKRIISLIALGEHNHLEANTLKKIKEILTLPRKQTESTEHRQLRSLVLLLLSRMDSTAQVKEFIPIAIKSLYESSSLPPAASSLYFNNLNSKNIAEQHPGISFLIAHGQGSLTEIARLLKDKSSLVRIRALETILSPMSLKSSSLIPHVLNTFSDPELEIRLTTYLTLINQTPFILHNYRKSLNSNQSSPNNKVTTFKPSNENFYISALMAHELGKTKNPENESVTAEEYAKLLQKVAEASSHQSCKERITVISSIIESRKIESSYINEQILKLLPPLVECINQSQTIRDKVASLLNNLPDPSMTPSLMIHLLPRTGSSFSSRGLQDMLTFLLTTNSNSELKQFITEYDFQEHELKGLLRWLILNPVTREQLTQEISQKLNEYKAGKDNKPGSRNLIDEAIETWTNFKDFPNSSLRLLSMLELSRDDLDKIISDIATNLTKPEANLAKQDNSGPNKERLVSILGNIDHSSLPIRFSFDLKISICKIVKEVQECKKFITSRNEHPLDQPGDILVDSLFLFQLAENNDIIPDYKIHITDNENETLLSSAPSEQSAKIHSDSFNSKQAEDMERVANKNDTPDNYYIHQNTIEAYNLFEKGIIHGGLFTEAINNMAIKNILRAGNKLSQHSSDMDSQFAAQDTDLSLENPKGQISFINILNESSGLNQKDPGTRGRAISYITQSESIRLKKIIESQINYNQNKSPDRTKSGEIKIIRILSNYILNNLPPAILSDKSNFQDNKINIDSFYAE
ncbi:MAG TPA: hypothetical protein PKA63_12325 [Oligoflexia bacterium]|nr:hypothetical protein [Oligoflexia bacterium]HMP49442.1 hypothetical protein [Oligoflexia bacterium]